MREFTLDTSALAKAAGATAVVTGGAGFIGSRLCDALSSCGWTVHSASRRPAGPESAVRHWQVDLTDLGATRALLESARPDYVFHLASHVWGAPGLEHVLPTFHGNLHTTVNLLSVLAETRCRRLVVTGSLVEPEPGSSDRVPSAPYAASKWASSDYVRMFHALYGLPGAIARVFMVYGPAQQDPTKLVPYAIDSLLRGEAPAITSGRRLIDWVYVDDVAYGLGLMALAPEIDGNSVDLGHAGQRALTLRRGRAVPVRDRPPPRLSAVAFRRRLLLDSCVQQPEEEQMAHAVIDAEAVHGVFRPLSDPLGVGKFGVNRVDARRQLVAGDEGLTWIGA